MKLNEPMSERQKERLDQLKINYRDDWTMEEAADAIRLECRDIIYAPVKPAQLPESAFVVESEGDRGDGRQWLK